MKRVSSLTFLESIKLQLCLGNVSRIFSYSTATRNLTTEWRSWNPYPNSMCNLFHRITSLGGPTVSIVPLLDQWVQEGRTVEKEQLQLFIKPKSCNPLDHSSKNSRALASPSKCFQCIFILDSYKKPKIETETPNFKLNDHSVPSDLTISDVELIARVQSLKASHFSSVLEMFREFHHTQPQHAQQKGEARSPDSMRGLFRRITPLGDPAVSIVPLLDQWVQEGRTVEKEQLQLFIKELRSSRRFTHALQVLTN
ncbi:hypothetical protein Patl1_32848 [Pistacia atlantica]|uniref:Uncharacterized protein n=1 Tax=Pistacia atlantica TaxID=434234 RepID=A0ACC1ANJ0_9ROSI|nr:hypothetical protein Patl1_32848 [Pistacia atlantica]